MKVYVKSFIVMVDQKLSSIPDFRKFLLRHPALVAFIGFHLKGSHPPK
ncbi:MAG: hypothetical protein QME14_09660 [Methanobacteriaceae archaeon]|nr:hypothetical protein [Methanobacteriaceae archaeon]